jgi:diguanylate cyclase (GGDEF)-like protein
LSAAGSVRFAVSSIKAALEWVDHRCIEMRTTSVDPGFSKRPGAVGAVARALGGLDRRLYVGLHGVVLLAGGLGVLAVARSANTWDSHLGVPWLVVAALFFLVEATALHIEIRREAHTLSLSGLPMLLGLLSLNPTALVAARLVGNGLALVAVRRRFGLKLGWNLALYTLETATAALIAAPALANGRPETVASWLQLLGAMLAAELIGLVSVPIVIMIAENEFRLSLFAQIGRSELIATVSATFGIVTAAAMLDQPWLAIFAIVPLAAVGWLLHKFGRLGKQHHDLQQLHRFTTAIAGRNPVDAGLSELTTILRASAAAIAVRNGDHSFRVVVHRDPARANETIITTAPPTSPQGVVRISAGDARTEAVELLEQLDGQAGLAIAITNRTSGSGYILLIDRLGPSNQFQDDEIQLFGSLATNLASRISAVELLDQLELQARTDPLTGLANRSAIEAELERRLADETIDAGTVLMLDLDRFKDVNDSLGHQFGDELLQVVADRLRHHLRDGDLAGRLGGDEFAVVLEPDHDVDLDRQFSSLAQRLMAPVNIQGVSLEINASIGAVSWPTDATSGTELLRLADIAMYEAKRTHQSWVRYEPSIDHASADRLALLGQVRDAIGNRELRIHLQPQIRLTDHALVGAEALLRWHHPERGLIPPAEFLPLAEQSSLASPITNHVIEEAIAAAQQLHAENSDLTIWINLTARDLLDQSLAPTIAAALLTAGIDPSRLGFEVTESSLIINIEMAITTLNAVRQLGCRTSIDDFGTGYASLQYLQRLPIDEVKIDQFFIRDATTNPEAAAIIRSTTRLIQDLGMTVVAEGVETGDTLDLLTDIGCDIVQGYLISRPLDLASFTTWTRNHRESPALAAANWRDDTRC